MDFSTRLRGINPTNTVFYSPEPRAEVYCLQMNFKISKFELENVGFCGRKKAREPGEKPSEQGEDQ